MVKVVKVVSRGKWWKINKLVHIEALSGTVQILNEQHWLCRWDIHKEYLTSLKPVMQKVRVITHIWFSRLADFEKQQGEIWIKFRAQALFTRSQCFCLSSEMVFHVFYRFVIDLSAPKSPSDNNVSKLTGDESSLWKSHGHCSNSKAFIIM